MMEMMRLLFEMCRARKKCVILILQEIVNEMERIERVFVVQWECASYVHIRSLLDIKCLWIIRRRQGKKERFVWILQSTFCTLLLSDFSFISLTKIITLIRTGKPMAFWKIVFPKQWHLKMNKPVPGTHTYLAMDNHWMNAIQREEKRNRNCGWWVGECFAWKRTFQIL